jgi:glycosyltransferase involved in cell wall biosynthesis
MGTNISVLITVRNVEKCISQCIASLLGQTFSDFEIIIIDDVSTDNTKEIIEKFKDKRIRYFRNKNWLGLSRSRNECLARAKGDYLFFTDGDCIISKNWIEEGLKYLKTANCIGVEGKTYYVSKEYKPTRSDDVVENKTRGLFMTCNIAYKKGVLESIGGFDERFTFHEDLDLALRALKFGKILFNPQMIVYHQKKTFKPMQFAKKGKIVGNRILLYKKFGKNPNLQGLRKNPVLMWRIGNPKDLMALIFPPLIFTSLFRNAYKSKEDFNLLPFIYLRLIYERLELWKTSATERFFLI